MFSRGDAEALRAQLGPIDFRVPTPESALVSAYRTHYGLQFAETSADPGHHIGTFTSGDYKLVCQYFALPGESTRGCALLLHGYFDHTGLFGHLIRHCLSLGYSVVIFDLPGHGLSSGSPASIDSFQDYVAALSRCIALARDEVPGPLELIGQSTGGAVMLDSLLQQTPELTAVDHFILLCPLLYPVKWTTSRLLYYLMRVFTDASPRRFAANSHDQKFLAFLKNEDALQARQIPGLWVAAMIDYQRRFIKAAPTDKPLHIVQGTDDGTVDWQRNLAQIGKKFSGVTTHLVTDAKHHLVNESESYRGQVFSKITEILSQEG